MLTHPAGRLEMGQHLPTENAAALTQGHPSGQVSSGALVVIPEGLLAGDDLADAVGLALDSCDSVAGGWVGEEALAIAVFCAHSCPKRDEVLEALRLAVFHGGEALPTELLTSVEGAETVRHLALRGIFH